MYKRERHLNFIAVLNYEYLFPSSPATVYVLLHSRCEAKEAEGEGGLEEEGLDEERGTGDSIA